MGQGPSKPKPPYYTGADNFRRGWKANPQQAASAFYFCDYCGSKNNRAREECRKCRAPLPERTARVRETTWKGVPLSRLTEAERDEAAEYLVDEMRDGCRPMPAILTINTEYGGYIEQGAEPLNRAILKRIRQVVGLR